MAVHWGLGPVICRGMRDHLPALAGVCRTILAGRERAGRHDPDLAHPVRAPAHLDPGLRRSRLGVVDAIMAVELVLAIAIVPAAAAGAICQDKMRGGLTLMMVTTSPTPRSCSASSLRGWSRSLGLSPAACRCWRS